MTNTIRTLGVAPPFFSDQVQYHLWRCTGDEPDGWDRDELIACGRARGVDTETMALVADRSADLTCEHFWTIVQAFVNAGA